MVRKLFLLTLIPAIVFLGSETAFEAQESPDVHVVVNLVQLNVAVTDKNGKPPVCGPRPSPKMAFQRRHRPLRRATGRLAVSPRLREAHRRATQSVVLLPEPRQRRSIRW